MDTKPDPANKPETNLPQTGTVSAQPGQSLSNPLGQANSAVVPPYPNQNLEPLRPAQPVQAPKPLVAAPTVQAPRAQAGPALAGAPHNQRPAVGNLEASKKKEEEKTKDKDLIKFPPPAPVPPTKPAAQTPKQG